MMRLLLILALTAGIANAVVVTTTTLPSTNVNATYPNQQLQASGGTTPYTWTLASGSLCNNFSISSAGVLSNIFPVSSGSCTFTVRVTDSLSATATGSLTITVDPGQIANATPLVPATYNSAYSQAFSTSPSNWGTGPYVWTTGRLPAGITLSAGGVLSGTPTAVDSGIQLTVTITDNTGAQLSKNFAWDVNPIFSYLHPPVNCSNSGAPFAPGDLDMCTLPGETPFGTFAVPAVGQTYIDANFGNPITVLASFGATGPGVVHSYYSPSAFSATGIYAAIAVNTQTRIINAKTGALVCQTTSSNVVGGFPTGTLHWDAYNDDIFWWVNSGTKLSKFSVSSCTSKVDVLDFSSTASAIRAIDQRTGLPFGFTSIFDGGQGDTSKDNWVGYFSDAAHHTAVVINLNNLHIYAADYTVAHNGITPQAIADDGQNGSVFVSKGVDSVTGKRYAYSDSTNINVSHSAHYTIFSITGDPNDGLLNFELIAPEESVSTFGFEANGNGNNTCDPGEQCGNGEHEDSFESSTGEQYIVRASAVQFGRQNPELIAVLYYRLNAGVLMGRTAVEVAGGGLTVTYINNANADLRDHHLGCAKSGKSAPYCVLSTENKNPNLSPVTPGQATFTHDSHSGNISVLRDVGVEVRSLAYSRSPLYSYSGSGLDYWAYSRAAISSDGTHIIFDSNLGYANGPNNENVLMMATGFGLTACPAN